MRRSRINASGVGFASLEFVCSPEEFLLPFFFCAAAFTASVKVSVFFFKKEKVFRATPGFFSAGSLLASLIFSSGLGLRLKTAHVFWKAAEKNDFIFPKRTTAGLGPFGFFSFSSFEEASDLSFFFPEAELLPSLLSDWSILALMKSHDSRSSAAWDFVFFSVEDIPPPLRESF
ncbi:MAG: hypothetical protein ACI4UF_09420 [Thermoguttaceae bacterium]